MCTQSTSAASQDDLEVLKKRMVSSLLQPDIQVEHSRELADSLNQEGTWPDLGYESRRQSAWPTARHLERVKALARAWRKPRQPLHRNNDVLRGALKALDHWLERDYRNPNWWWNQIGVPGHTAEALLLLEPELSEDQMARGSAILQRAEPGMTGQNLVWLTLLTAQRGLLEGDARLVDRSFQRIQEEIRISGEEGVQPDYSFHQHGPCLYNHGYGAGFAVDCSRLAALVRGTRFRFTPEKIDILARYVLDGSRWMSRGRWADFGASGREITRKGANTCDYLAAVAHNMMKLNTGRRQEFSRLLSRIEEGQPPLAGNRYFWCSDFMTHHRPGWYVSARMYSQRTVNTDHPCNDEGLLSHHIADGASFIVRTGGEYRCIVPVWDWQKIPGTTVVQKHELQGSPRRQGLNRFVGGISDATVGAASFRFEHETDHMRARKSWFFFTEAVVCLGTGISASSHHPVLTTLNQCRLRGPVEACSEAGRMLPPMGQHALEEVSWVLHDRIGYVFPSPTTVRMSNQNRTGNWWRINRQYSDQNVEEEIFSLWLDHGIGPQDARYSYVILPDVESEGLSRRAASLPYDILRNAPALQAVLQARQKLLQAAFFEPGRLESPHAPGIAVEEPCLLMLRYGADTVKLAVSDPTRELSALHVHIDRRLAGPGAAWSPAEGTTRITIDLPAGPRAGSTRSLELEPNG